MEPIAGPCTGEPDGPECTSCLDSSVPACNTGACKAEADAESFCAADCATVYGTGNADYDTCYDRYCRDDRTALHTCWFQKCPDVKGCY